MAYTAITDKILSVIKAPPLVAPAIDWSWLNTVSENNVKNYLFQFSARFIYDDYEKSVLGPVSEVLTVNNRYSLIGSQTTYIKVINRILATYEIPDDDTLLSMDIVVRFSNYGIWYIADNVDVTGSLGASYNYYFYNNKSLIPLDQIDAVRPYDYVPILAGAQQIIGGVDGAYLTYGDITEGRDRLETITATFTYKGSKAYPNYQVNIGATQIGGYTFEIDLTSSDDQNASLQICISGDGDVYRYVYPYLQYWNESTGSVDGVPIDDVGSFFVSRISENEIVSSVTYDNATDVLTIVFQPNTYEMEVTAVRYLPASVTTSLKKGATHYFGIYYIDEYGRRSSVYKDDDMSFYVPSLPEEPVAHAGDWHECQVALDYTVSHTPPIWAHKWGIVYGGNSISWFQQFLIRSHDRDDKSIFTEGDVVKIKINEGINNVRDQISNYYNNNYIWSHGDRMRILAGTDPQTYDGNEDPDPRLDSVVDDYYDEEILGFDGIYIYVPSWSAYANIPDPSTTDYDYLIEIYKVRREDEDVLYNGIGQQFDISDPGTASRAHDDASDDIQFADIYLINTPVAYLAKTGPYVEEEESDITTTTTTTTTWGDIEDYSEHIGTRTILIESNQQSAFMKNSNQRTIGELHIVNEDEKQVRLNNVRYSGIHIGKTFINKLNRFDYDDDVAFDDKHGRLFSLEELGYTLKVLQRNKLTSLYVGREMSLDANGNEQMVYTDNVLGSKRPSVEDYGTDQPDGVVVSSRYLYFPDVSHGVIVRDSPNGQEEVSKYGMESYIRDLFKYLRGLDTSDYKIIAGVDRSRDMVYFTILDYDTPANTVTLAFDEKAKPTQDGRYSPWRSFYSFNTAIEHYGSVGQESFLTFLAGALWKHHSDTADRGSFHGGKAEQELWLVSNANPAMEKHYEAIELVSNEPWTITDNDSIIIASNTRYPNGMQSKILSGEWAEYGGVFRASFMKDMLTGDNTTVDLYYLHNGRELRGREMLIKLKNAETGEVNLFLIKVISNISK